MDSMVELQGHLLGCLFFGESLYQEGGFLSVRRNVLYWEATQTIHTALGLTRPIVDDKIELL